MSLSEISERAKRYQSDLLAFTDSHVYPAESVWQEQVRASGDPHFHPPGMEDLKADADALKKVTIKKKE